MNHAEMKNNFLDLLYQQNQVINLVSRQLSRQDLEQHWEDSVAGSPLLKGEENCLDIGSGGGFPALPLAIINPEVTFTLVEAELKKCKWLDRAISDLGLSNVKVVRGRVEVLGHDPQLRERYNVVTARAVAELRILLEYGLPFVRPGGVLVAWKGPGAAKEISQATNALKVLKGRMRECKYYQLQDEERNLVLIEKTGRLPDSYPRGEGIPKKRPL